MYPILICVNNRVGCISDELSRPNFDHLSVFVILIISIVLVRPLELGPRPHLHAACAVRCRRFTRRGGVLCGQRGILGPLGVLRRAYRYLGKGWLRDVHTMRPHRSLRGDSLREKSAFNRETDSIRLVCSVEKQTNLFE